MATTTQNHQPSLATILELADMTQLRRFTREEFYAMDRAGIFDNDYGVELIDGRIIARMAPIGGDHAWSVGKLARALFQCTENTEYEVHIQSAISLPEDRELQPDLVVYKPREDSHDNPTPDQILLVIEVSDTSLRFDRTSKSELYAAANIPEYWVIDVRHKAVHVYTQPEDGVYTRTEARSTDVCLMVCGREIQISSLF